MNGACEWSSFAGGTVVTAAPESIEDQRTYRLPNAARRMLAPRERVSVSHWCDRYRRLQSRFAAEPGPWRTAKVPYLREPLDALAETELESITFIKCSRIGGTEWQNNALAWGADVRPMPTLYVQPERTDVADEFTGRIKSIFEDGTRQLTRHIPAGEWCSKEQITLDSCTLYGAWARNHNTLIRRTIGRAIFDEIENCEEQTGHLGNTLDALGERLVTYGHRAQLLIDSTPRRPDGSGWKSLQASDFRQPHVPCPHCGQYQVLVFQQIKVPPRAEGEERDPDQIRDQQLAWYECAHCEQAIDHATWHQWMIDRVVWIPKQQRPTEPLPVPPEGLKPGASGGDIVDRQSLAVPPYDPWDPRYSEHVQWTPALEGTPPRSARRGYWINVLYSPWPTRTWSHIIARWFEIKDDPERRRVFFNSWLGEPYEEAVHVTDADKLAEKRAGELPAGVVDPRAKVLLMGVDVQLLQLYYVIRAIGPGEESWLVQEGTITTGEQFNQLYQLAFYTGFPVAGHDGLEIRCRCLGVDSGYAARLDEVYEFGELPGVLVMKGQGSPDYRTKPSKIDWTPAGRRDPRSLVIHHVNTSLFKEKAHRHANIAPGNPGYWHLNRDTSMEYCKQFTAEKQVLENASGKRGGRRQLVWKPKTEGAPNHWLDTEVYVQGLVDILHLGNLKESDERQCVIAGESGEQKPRRARRRGERGEKPGGEFGGFVQ